MVNLLSVVQAALRAVHGSEKVEQEVSCYDLADEMAGTWPGMLVMLPGDFWEERFASQTPTQLAAFLRRAARQIRREAFRKHRRGPKNKPPGQLSKQGRRHVATQRILTQKPLTASNA